MGRPPIGKTAMGATERWRRWYAKQRTTRSNETRQAGERSFAAEVAAVKRDNAILREQVATLIRERDEAREARQTKSNETRQAPERSKKFAADEVLLAGFRRDNDALRQQVMAMTRELDEARATLKDRPTDPDQRIAELERQLKAARTRIRNLTLEAAQAWQAAQSEGTTIKKSDLNAIRRALHSDKEPSPTRAARRSLTRGWRRSTASNSPLSPRRATNGR
jgi:hypothetical protein